MRLIVQSKTAIDVVQSAIVLQLKMPSSISHQVSLYSTPVVVHASNISTGDYLVSSSIIAFCGTQLIGDVHVLITINSFS